MPGTMIVPAANGASSETPGDVSYAVLVRQLVAIMALPGTVVIAIPVWVAERNHLSFSAPRGPSDLALVLCGAALLVVGVTLFVASVHYFWSRGLDSVHRTRATSGRFAFLPSRAAVDARGIDPRHKNRER